MMFTPTITFDMKYRLVIGEDVHSLTRWMSVRSKYFQFRIKDFNPHKFYEIEEGDMVQPVKEIVFTIPSVVESELIDEHATELYLKLLGTDLLKKVERRLGYELENQWIEKGLGFSPKWKFNWTKEEEPLNKRNFL